MSEFVHLNEAIFPGDLMRQMAWSFDTFGPPRGDQPNAGVIDHIRKEIEEVAAEPFDLSEWVDIIILAFDGALRAGHLPGDIIAGYHEKQSINMTRNWPDWRTAEPGKAIEHIRDEEVVTP